MPKAEIKGIITGHGDSVGASGRKFCWFSLNLGGNRGTVKVIGFYPQGVGPRCQGLDYVHKKTMVTVSGTSRGDVFFADTVTKITRTYGFTLDGPPVKAGPWDVEGTVVVFRHGKSKDWLEIVTLEGDQVPVTAEPGVLGPDALGKKYKFSGKANKRGFRHIEEVQAMEDA